MNLLFKKILVLTLILNNCYSDVTESISIDSSNEISEEMKLMSSQNLNFDSDFHSQVSLYPGTLEGAKTKTKISSGEFSQEQENKEVNEDLTLIGAEKEKIKFDWKNGEEMHISELELADCYVDFSPHLESNHYEEKVLKVDCGQWHNSQIIYKKSFEDIFLDTLELELQSTLRCNQARSFFQIVEYIDQKYGDYIFFTESIFDGAAVQAGVQNEIICISYFENFNYQETTGLSAITLNESVEPDRKKAFINWSFYEDIEYWVLGTSWEGEHDFGVACHSPAYLSDPFHAEFLLYFSQSWGRIEEMIFEYSNSEITISINLLDILNNFTEEGQGFDEQIFYYFLPISQISIYGILSLENVDFLDLIFTEVPENVSGEFSYVTSQGERFTASCSMDDDF